MAQTPIVELLQHQLDLINTTHRETALIGGLRSGKTYTACIMAIMLAAKNSPNDLGCVIEPTFALLRDVFVTTFEHVLAQYNVPYSHKKADSKIILHFADGDRTILLKSGEDPEKIVGITAAWMIIDEIDTMPLEKATTLYNNANNRITKGNMTRMIVVTSPEGYSRFCYDYFVKQVQDKPELANTRRVIKASTRNNHFIDPYYIQSIMDRYPAKIACAYLDGDFVSLNNGIVYESYDRKLNNTDKTLEDFPNHIIHIGLDFNFNNMAACIGIIDQGNMYTVDEIVGLQNTQAMIDEILRRYPANRVIIYPDSAGAQHNVNASQSSISLINQNGLRTNYHRKHAPIADRVMSVNVKHKNGKGDRTGFVNVAKCPKLVNGLEIQGYDKDGKPDKNSNIDHVLDAYGYMIEYNFPVSHKPTLRFRS